MMTILWPEDTVDVIDDIRVAIGRNIQIFYTVSGIPCSGCSLDPITNLSTDPFCGTCDGEYWLNSVSGYTVNAHVRVQGIDIPIWTTGGYVVEGDAEVQIKYTATSVDVVNSAEYYVVDSKKYFAKKISMRGVPNRSTRQVIVFPTFDISLLESSSNASISKLIDFPAALTFPPMPTIIVLWNPVGIDPSKNCFLFTCNSSRIFICNNRAIVIAKSIAFGSGSKGGVSSIS